MLANKALAAALRVLYPVKLKVELRIEQGDVTSNFHYLLQARGHALGVIPYRQNCGCTAFATQQTLWIGNTVCLPTRVWVVNLVMMKRKLYVRGR